VMALDIQDPVIAAPLRRAFSLVLCLLGALIAGCRSPAGGTIGPGDRAVGQRSATESARSQTGLLTVAAPTLVAIRGGPFVMGSQIDDENDPAYHDDERPVDVMVEDFWIGRTPVTASEFCLFLNSSFLGQTAPWPPTKLYTLDGPESRYKWSTITMQGGRFVPRHGAERSPANRVTWLGAMFYCHWLETKTGRACRLPTEAEWEYVARGEDGRLWPWGNSPPDKTRGNRWTHKPWNAEAPWTKCPVGSFPAGATPEGVMDLLGYRGGEWCINKYKENPTPEEANNSSQWTLRDSVTHRVIRGVVHRIGSKQRLVDSLLAKQATRRPGRAWTRAHDDPQTACRMAYEFGAGHGFRIASTEPADAASDPSASGTSDSMGELRHRSSGRIERDQHTEEVESAH